MIINDREYKIIIPKWDNSGRKIRPDELEDIGKKMSEHFGGVTIFPSVLGCWKDPEGKLQCEENAVFSSFSDSESFENWEMQKKIDEEFIKNLAEDLGKRFGQESIVIAENKVEVNFIKGKYQKELPSEKLGIDWFKKLI